MIFKSSDWRSYSTSKYKQFLTLSLRYLYLGKQELDSGRNLMRNNPLTRSYSSHQVLMLKRLARKWRKWGTGISIYLKNCVSSDVMDFNDVSLYIFCLTFLDDLRRCIKTRGDNCDGKILDVHFWHQVWGLKFLKDIEKQMWW